MDVLDACSRGGGVCGDDDDVMMTTMMSAEMRRRTAYWGYMWPWEARGEALEALWLPGYWARLAAAGAHAAMQRTAEAANARGV